MVRPPRAAAALAGKRAKGKEEPKAHTSPYFSRGKAASSSSSTRKATSSPSTKGKGKAKEVVEEEEQDDDDDDEGEGGVTYIEYDPDEESETSSEDSADAADDYKAPDSDAIDDEEADEEDEEEEEDSEEETALDSDDIDGDVQNRSSSKKKQGTTSNSKKRKNNNGTKSPGSSSPSKRGKKIDQRDSDFNEDGDDDNGHEDESDEDSELDDGRKIKRTKLVKAPSSKAKPGIIDTHTMQFLRDLKANNDREWFARNDARYRHALSNWQDFVAEIQTEFQKGDWSIPEMPPKDLIHRIYRDVRFSNDKTPYKINFAASFSRTGRKGPFAGYYLQISPNGRSLLAGGKWSPDKNDLATIRTNILRTSKPLRKVISAPRFVKMFGPAKVDGNGKGERCNIFGADDMLKVAPKMNNVDKTHKDIDLLKLRTIGVVYYFKDEDITKPDFRSKVGEAVEAMSPLVLLLNDMLHPQSDAEEEEEETDDEEVEDNDGGSSLSEPGEEEQDKIEVTAASGKLCESAANDQEPVEEDDSDAIEGEGGIEEA